MTLAWTAEALYRQKHLPDLKTLMAKREVRQSPRQMRTVLQQISEKYRIPLKTMTKKQKARRRRG